MANNQDIYHQGGGGGIGSYVLPIYKDGDEWKTKTNYRQLFQSYNSAESLYLSVLKSDNSYAVLDIDTVTKTETGLQFVAPDYQEGIMYIITANKGKKIEITTKPIGGGVAGDITYEEI